MIFKMGNLYAYLSQCEVSREELSALIYVDGTRNAHPVRHITSHEHDMNTSQY
jgi:hypothetical protein